MKPQGQASKILIIIMNIVAIFSCTEPYRHTQSLYYLTICSYLKENRLSVPTDRPKSLELVGANDYQRGGLQHWPNIPLAAGMDIY